MGSVPDPKNTHVSIKQQTNKNTLIMSINDTEIYVGSKSQASVVYANNNNNHRSASQRSQGVAATP